MRKKRAITIKYIACHEYIGSESVSHTVYLIDYENKYA